MLCEHPQFADRCDKYGGWDNFETSNWDKLLKYQPDFIEKAKEYETGCAILLFRRPELVDECRRLDEIYWDYWGIILAKNPQLADRFNRWNEINFYRWMALLKKQPQFAEKAKESLDGWLAVLITFPKLASSFDKWNELGPRDWLKLLKKRPEFADKCDKFGDLDTDDWEELLGAQPLFAEKARKCGVDPNPLTRGDIDDEDSDEASDEGFLFDEDDGEDDDGDIEW
ncbi:MAG: hypothetical protein IKO42_07115 [Opitutales bacterium]|nr:hypothetical protein [Opitutales bacterium]